MVAWLGAAPCVVMLPVPMKYRMRRAHVIRALLLGAALALTACGETPERTEEARGLLSGLNVVLALTIVFLVVAGALAFGAVALDRTLKARRALDDAAPAPEEEVEEEEEVVAGIGVGRAPVPRWLYGFYVVIPLFALLYVLNAVALRPPQAEEPDETPAPTGPVTEVTIVARSIRFDLDVMTFPANTPVTITFDNQDAGVPHNVAVYESQPPAPEIFVGDIFPGVAERDYSFTTPGPGEYYFHCDVHPSMNGSVEVVAS